MAPRHKNPTTPGRTAIAPYNFVPLPNEVFTVEDGDGKPWRQHDRFVPGTYSGWFDVQITTLTPLYIRGATRQNETGDWDTRAARFRAAPFARPDERPLVPGASLRGAIRSLFEIFTFSKIQPVSKERPFFRSVGTDRMAKEYRRRVVQGDTAPQGGFIRRRNGAWVIERAEATWRVKHDLLRRHGLQYRQHPSYKPTWTLQHHRCWFHPGTKDLVKTIALNQPSSGSGWREGILVLTGSSPKKEKEFLFVESTAPQHIIIPDAIWKRFHDDDQITQWQKKTFPRGEPTDKCRKQNGHLRDGEPVFFLCDPQHASPDNPAGLLFFGRAQMFRFPYDLRPNDLIPRNLKTEALDLTEVVFGRVGQQRDKRGQTIKGRVFVEDAVAVGQPPAGGWLESILVPKILSAPKPTTFQHYLTQDGTKGTDNLTTYFDGNHTSIRGHKMYWHRWDNSLGIDAVREDRKQNEILDYLQKTRSPLENDKQEYTQHTMIQPVKADVTFKGRIRFENLTDIELGALLAVVQLPDGCAHKIGMAKPLGLGSVRIEARLRLVDHQKRYDGWQDDGIVEGDPKALRAAFTKGILKHAEESRETLLEEQTDLRRIARLEALYRLLEWENRPAVEDTRYMVIEGGDGQRVRADTQGRVNEYRERPVLPSPHKVAGTEEPPWEEDPPHPGSGRDRSSGAPPRQQKRAASGPSLPSSGDRVEAVLSEKLTNKGGWRAEHVETNLSGPIHNTSDVPSDKKPGDTLHLLVASVNQREIAFRYPTEADEARAQRASKPKGKRGRQQHRR